MTSTTLDQQQTTSSRWFDLSHPMNEGTPHPPKADPPRFTVAQELGPDISQITNFSLCTHMGTHMDAPSHFVVGARSITDYPIERFAISAAVAHLELGDGDVITVEHLAHLADVIVPGGGLLIGTGMDRHFGSPEYVQHPYLSVEAAAWIREKGVSLVGIDFMTPDMPIHLRPEGYDCPVHMELLGHDILIIENLTGLQEFDETLVELVAAPIALTDLDGAPVRVVVRIPNGATA